MIRLLFAILLLIISNLPSYALDMDNFKTIPVLEEGRLKPLDSFARAHLKTLSGQDRNAIEFLAETLFTPQESITKPIFKVENGNLRHSLGLTERKTFLYSFTELVPGLKKTSSVVTALLKKDPKLLSRDEKDLLKIHDNAMAYTSLMRSLSLLLPLNINLPDKYSDQNTKTLSYLDLKKLEQDLDHDLKNIISKKGENIDRYSNDEKKTALLAFQLQLMSSAAATNDLLKIVPPQWESDKGDWHAPWELLQKGEGSPEAAKLLNIWRDMGAAFTAQDEAAWNKNTSAALTFATDDNLRFKLKAETLQNSFPPFKISTAFYALAFIAALLFFVTSYKITYRTSLALLLTGAGIHFVGLALRIYLLSRPPVGTLYESLIFVSLITVLIALAVEKHMKNGTGFLIGSLSGLALGLLSISFAGDGDTLEMLTAVLNTNFWLATHVLCITMGYGWCILTAIFAHFYLASDKFRNEKSNFILHTLAILALLFTAIGTILGGIWADQSWGRFWGWDPKENGALLIVLWLIWLLHGKLGRQLDDIQFLAGLAYLNVIVGLSWIGVNLLGVGLHSYGFADGLFYGLGLFVLAETALIGFLWNRARHKRI